MTKNIDSRKVKLMATIAAITEERQVALLEKYVAELQRLAQVADIFKPTRKNVTIEDLIKEQNYKGVNKERIDQLIDELDIQEPIEQLLSQL